MSAIAEREDAFEDLLRLRRVERRYPSDREIAIVRMRFERRLGGTVSKSQAARLLGVTHTGLEYWIRAGDVDTVISPEGRPVVPLAELVELAESRTREDFDEADEVHPLKELMKARRRRAAELVIDGRLFESIPREAPHSAAHRRSLAYHQQVALRLSPALITQAHARLDLWESERKIAKRYADVWRRVLDMPDTEIKAAILDPTLEGRDLRQNTPFVGVLTGPERRRLYALVDVLAS